MFIEATKATQNNQCDEGTIKVVKVSAKDGPRAGRVVPRGTRGSTAGPF